MTDLLAKLNPASWKDIRFPITGEREYGFAQEYARHRIILQDDQLLADSGRENPTFVYTIPFIESLRTAEWDNLFTKVYPRFLEECKTSKPGWLRDPVHGRVWAKCASLREILGVSNRSGVIVTAEFVQDPEDETTGKRPAEMPITSLAGAAEQGRKIDEEVIKVEVERQEEPESTQDIFTSVQAFSDQVSLLRDNSIAKIGNVRAKMERLTQSIDEMKDPKLGVLRNEVRRLQLSSIYLKDTLTTPPRPVDIITTTNEIGKIAFAAAHNMAVDDLHRANPMLKNALTIPAGMDVVVYRG